MKRRMKCLAVFLALVMVITCVPASAAGNGGSGFSSLSDWWEALVSVLTGGNDTGSADSVKGEIGEAVSTNVGSDANQFKLVEDETTVTEGTNLRANTYLAGDVDTLANGDGTDIRYFGVTLYNYDTDGINEATRTMEAEEAIASGETSISEWSGLYFSSGNPIDGNGLYDDLPDSQSIITGEVKYTPVSVEYSRLGNYNQYENGDYYYNSNGEYIRVTSLDCDRYRYWGDYYYYWTINNSIHTSRSNKSITLYRASGGIETVTAGGYADYNYWTGQGAVFANTNGNYIYSGLVQSTLTSNGQIQFNEPQAGLFDSSTNSYRNVYTNVGLPFVYDSDDQSYTFDSSQMGAYFSGTPASNTNLYYSDTPQNNGGGYGDGSTTVWMPFNNSQSINGEGSCDYHFGMRASIPFTMTSTGTLDNTDSGAPITFDFSGDDDVWVFIDGQLVLDLGGIHNCMGGTLDFANNRWELKKGEGNKSDGNIGDVNGSSREGKIFNDENGAGVLNQTRETFAATDTHQLTIFYLERGAGSSNCKIKFNLPMNDTVSVRKEVSGTDDEGMPLDSETMQSINNQTFTFILYEDGTPVRNTNYRLFGSDGAYLGTPSTSGSGRFTLRNGQTAEFTKEISVEGSQYYVVEELSDEWTDPAYTQTTSAANGYTGDAQNTGKQSMTVTARGSSEAEDSISFVCTNTLKHVTATSIIATDDRIVIDYGLPVEIDVLANDAPIGGTLSLEEGTEIEGEYGTAVVQNGKLVYTLNQPLTRVETLTYTVYLTASSGVAEDNKTATAKVYIIPATSMYYEENFSGLVDYSDGWTPAGSSQGGYQEEGVVGTGDYSPYGSDKVYQNNSGDSYGTSRYVNTSNSAASFSYKFTGTGTTFFARTTNNSGYMRVVITDSNGNTVYTGYRDTSYKTENSTTILYNIPVFTWSDQAYGTYTVTVSLANTHLAEGYGSDFWLDGIRVYNPIDPEDIEIADNAYSADGEAHCTVVTLRQKLISDATIETDGSLEWAEQDQTDGNFVVFTDSNGEILSASEYVSKGPKEELYLNHGQKVSFSLSNWDANSNRIYLGIKAPMGNGSVRINGHTTPINNTTDCYYEITNGDITTGVDGVPIVTFEIEAVDAVISVTNIKVTGNAEFTIIEEENEIIEGGNGEEGGNITVDGPDSGDSETTVDDGNMDVGQDITVYEGQNSAVKKVMKTVPAGSTGVSEETDEVNNESEEAAEETTAAVSVSEAAEEGEDE